MVKVYKTVKYNVQGSTENTWCTMFNEVVIVSSDLCHPVEP